MEGFFSWQALATFAGCSLAVGVITQTIKGWNWLLKIPTQLVSYIIAFIILVIAQLALNNFTWDGFALNFVNAFVIALATNGGYDAIKGVITRQEEVRKAAASLSELKTDVSPPPQ